ncbi:MAG: glycosyltransferase family 2 protein [Parachlamydiales bacterium]
MGWLIFLILLPTTVELLIVTIGALLPRRNIAQKEPLEGKWVIVIPAHNEETQIAHLLHSLKANAIQAEVIVIADNCNDATAEISRKMGYRVIERIDTLNRGKNKALHYAFDILLKEDFDWFVVLDADCIVEPNFIASLQAYAQKGVSAIQAYYGMDKSASHWRQKLMRVAFYSMNYLRPRGRSRLGLSCGILGLGFALHRSVLLQVPFDTHAIAEDLWYHCALVQAKIQVFFCDETAAYASAPIQGKGAATQRARWEGGRLRVARELFPRLVEETFHGNWHTLEPLFELTSLPLAYYALLLIPLAFFWPTAAIFSFLLLALHILTSIALKGQLSDLWVLASAPFYILWKLTLLKDIFKAAKSDAEWVRTDRDKK